METIAWESNSPLWQCIEDSGRPVPSCEDTAGSCPVSVSNIKKIQSSATSNINLQMNCQKYEFYNCLLVQSPITTAAERFQSPIPNSLAKKKLFGDGNIKTTPGKSLLQNSSPKAYALVLIDGKGEKKFIPISEINGETSTANTVNNTNIGSSNTLVKPTPESAAKPRRNGSLALFFRKVRLLLLFAVFVQLTNKYFIVL